MIFCYLKYMMDKLYYHYIEILLHWGLTGFIVKMIIFFALSIHEYKNDIDKDILLNLRKFLIKLLEKDKHKKNMTLILQILL